MNSSDEIDAFFETPYKNLGTTGQFSVLYLLRRDILICFGLNPDDQKQIEFRALWPGAMAVLAGIDLLAKFNAGDDSIGKVGQRFCDFIKEYFDGVSAKDEEIIYQLRNSLLHSFGLYSNGKNGPHHFSMTAAHQALVTKLGTGQYHVDIFSLYDTFEKAIEKYRLDIKSKKDVLAKFKSMIENYGFVTIQ